MPALRRGRVYKSKICLSVLYYISRGFKDFKMTKTQTQTNTKCFKDPMYVIFFKSTGFKDFKYDMDMDM